MAYFAVLTEDGHLLLLRQRVELALAAQRVPDVPLPRRVGHHAARPVEQPVGQVRLVTERVRAPHHCVLRFKRQCVKSAAPQKRPHRPCEMIGVLAPRQQRDAARIVGVFIEHAFQLFLLITRLELITNFYLSRLLLKTCFLNKLILKTIKN